MTKSSRSTRPSRRKINYADIDIHEVMRHQRVVGILWGTEDVLEVRPDLNDDQAWEVSQECYRRHDCEVGFTWVFIDCIADELFPAPAEDAGE